MPAWHIEAHKLLVGDEILLEKTIFRITAYQYDGTGAIVRLRANALSIDNTWEPYPEHIALDGTTLVVRTHRGPAMLDFLDKDPHHG